MDVVEFGRKVTRPVALALGFFDCLHLGHRAILDSLRGVCPPCALAVFTFENNPFAVLGSDTRLIYTFSERAELLSEIGADCVLSARFSPEFMNVPPPEFLRTLTDSCDIKRIACGADYSFGKAGAGGVPELRAFCAEKGIECIVAGDVTDGGEKVSSTRIRAALAGGRIEEARRLLGAPYFISGRVERGRKVGRTLSFPTANIALPADKLRLPPGVYAANAVIGGRRYPAVTNCGGRPTYGIDGYGIESYIIDYNNDIYGETVRIEFLSYLRGIRAFGTAEQLRAQIAKDVRARRTMSARESGSGSSAPIERKT
jgi:riboflavin kinase/FMN adenylyltransferase